MGEIEMEDFNSQFFFCGEPLVVSKEDIKVTPSFTLDEECEQPTHWSDTGHDVEFHI